MSARDDVEPADAGDRFRGVGDVRLVPVGSGYAVAHQPWLGRAALLGPRDQALLACCGRFASMVDLAHAAAARTGIEVGEARARLDALVEGGWLVSERALRSALLAGGADERVPSIARIGIPTRGRPQSLGRLVTSLRGTRAEILVIDDGRADAERNEVRRALRGAPVPVVYADRDDRARWADELAREAAVDPEIARAALVGDAGGCRNALLLAAAGEAIAMFDDDTIAELIAPPEVCGGIALRSRGPDQSSWFPADTGSEAASLGAPALEHALAAHERILGRAVSTCAGVGAPRDIDIDIEEASAPLLEIALRGGRVACSQLGLAGDAASGSVGHYLLYRGASRERLVVSEAVYARALASRQVLRAVTRTTITDGASLMAYAMAIDARTLRPPFPATHRNGDDVFAAALRACDRDALFGHVPRALRHEPPEPRRGSIEEVMTQVTTVGDNDILALLIRTCRPAFAPTETDAAIDLLGRALAAAGGMAAPDFERAVVSHVVEIRAREIAALNDALVRHGCEPSYWAQDVRRVLLALEQALDDVAAARRREVVDVRAHVRGYAALLSAWPSLWRAAIDLKSRGRRLGSPLAPT